MLPHACSCILENIPGLFGIRILKILVSNIHEGNNFRKHRLKFMS